MKIEISDREIKAIEVAMMVLMICEFIDVDKTKIQTAGALLKDLWDRIDAKQRSKNERN